MSGHTWILGTEMGRRDGILRDIIVSSDGRTIAREADAQPGEMTLAMAAPDLLAACDAAVENGQHDAACASYVEIAASIGVDESTVRRAISGRAWRSE